LIFWSFPFLEVVVDIYIFIVEGFVGGIVDKMEDLF
jgi:hypothetical protein